MKFMSKRTDNFTAVSLKKLDKASILYYMSTRQIKEHYFVERLFLIGRTHVLPRRYRKEWGAATA